MVLSNQIDTACVQKNWVVSAGCRRAVEVTLLVVCVVKMWSDRKKEY